MKYDVSGYIIKIWVTTVFISPMFSVFLLFAHNSGTNGLYIYPLALIMGGFFSIPATAIFWLLCKFLVYKIENKEIIKLLLTPVAIILTYVEFLAVNGFEFGMNTLTLGLCISYSVITLAGIWIYRIKVLGIDEDECDPGMMT
jgi:hypothetical protein